MRIGYRKEKAFYVLLSELFCDAAIEGAKSSFLPLLLYAFGARLLFFPLFGSAPL